MFMSPTTDITTPLYGHQCYLDCGKAKDDGYCGIASVLTACPVTCGGAAAG